MTHVERDSRYRWVVLLLCWAAFTMTSVDRSTWGPAASSVSDSLGVPLAALGIFATCYYIGYVVSNAGGGVLTDWLGGRTVLGASSLVCGMLMFAFGSTTSIPMGLAVQAVLGLFAGVDYAAGLKLISRWFGPAQRGLAMGVFMTATSLGTVIANAVVPTVVARDGWGQSYRIFGVATVVVALACVALLRDGPRGEGRTRETPVRSRPDVRPLLHNRDLLLLGLAGFGGLWGTYGFVTWSNTLMVKGSHLSEVRAGIVLVIFATAAVVVKPLVGLVTDRLGLGRRIPCAVILGLFGLTLLWFGTLRSYEAFLWTAPLLGAVAYAYSPLNAAMIPELAGEGLVGSAAGSVNAVWQLGSVAVPAVIGPVFHLTDSFSAAFATLAAGPLIGAVVILRMRPDRPRDAREPAGAPVALG